MEVREISNLFDKYGFKGAIFILFIFVIISFIKSSWLSQSLIKIFDKVFRKIIRNKNNSSVNMITESDVTNHDIFNYIDFWTYSKVPTFNFSTEYRTVVFRKYLTIYLMSHKKNLSSFVNSKEYQKMDDSKLWKATLELINKIIYDYEREIEEVGIPKVIIEKMKIKNNDTIILTIDLIEGICSSQFYSSDKNLLKVYSILNILLSILENTISNSEKICKSINGQLKGLIFEGKKEP
jgi:hypothetical protein